MAWHRWPEAYHAIASAMGLNLPRVYRGTIGPQPDGMTRSLQPPENKLNSNRHCSSRSLENTYEIWMLATVAARLIDQAVAVTDNSPESQDTYNGRQR